MVVASENEGAVVPLVAVVVGFKSFVVRCDPSGNNSRKGDSDILTVLSTATASRVRNRPNESSATQPRCVNYRQSSSSSSSAN